MSLTKGGERMAHAGTGIGEAIRARRHALSLTAEEAAGRAHISRVAWSNIERGTVKRPKESTLETIAEALGTSVQQLRMATAEAADGLMAAQDSYVMRLWNALEPGDREELLGEMIRRAVPDRSFLSADEPLAVAAG